MTRRKKGQAIVEFGPAMVLFVCCFLAPMIDVSFIPVRYFITQGVLNETAHRLCLAEKRTDAKSIAENGWWTGFLHNCGVTVHPEPLRVMVCGNDGNVVAYNAAEPIPSPYLPGGAKSPCVYAMELNVKADISPLFHGSTGLPGFTAPVSMNMSGRSNWENLSRDPATRKFYINE